MDTSRVFSRIASTNIAFTAMTILSLLFGMGCANYGSSSMNTLPGMSVAPPTAIAQFRMGDGPADRVISFEVTVGPATLNPSSGSPVTVISSPQRIELSHLSGTTAPLAVVKIPAASYTGITITVANPEVTFVNNLGQIMKIEPALIQTVTVNFTPPVTINASTVLSLDMNLANALTFDAQGNPTGVKLSPSAFTLSNAAVSSDENDEQEDNGRIEDAIGTVTNVSGNSFTLSVGQSGTALTFSTDSNTELKDGANLATLLNMMVKVEGVTKADGSMYAKEVEAIGDDTGMEAEGLITSVKGNPASQLSVVPQDGEGSGLDGNTLGNPVAIDVSNAQYEIDADNIDSSGLAALPSGPNFPFDATTVHAGQRVQVESKSGMGDSTAHEDGGSAKVEKVRLEQQGLRGTVSGLSSATSAGPATFTLTMPSDSAFAATSGVMSVQVFWQPRTQLHGLTAVTEGQTIEVRGLVFFTGSGFNMIAHRISE
jgi:hypothetical protein